MIHRLSSYKHDHYTINYKTFSGGLALYSFKMLKLFQRGKSSPHRRRLTVAPSSFRQELSLEKYNLFPHTGELRLELGSVARKERDRVVV
jgi:hypothetical protein